MRTARQRHQQFSVSKPDDIAILIVDNTHKYPALIKNVCRKMRDISCTTKNVKSLAKAAKKLEERKFDIILFNVNLRDTEEITTFQKVYNKDLRLPILLLIDYYDQRLAHAMVAGADDYLIKDQINAGLLERTLKYTIKNKKIEEEVERARKLRKVYENLRSVRDNERKRIAREIHDELGQGLTALKMDICWMEKNITKSPRLRRDKIKSINNLVDTNIKTVKKVTSDLRPQILDDFGLVYAMEWLTKEFSNRTGIVCNTDLYSGKLNIVSNSSMDIFRILQEALTNIARHANATKIAVSMQPKSNNMVLRVTDNGKGIKSDKAMSAKSFGIMGMRERVAFWNGKFKITSITGKGTTVTASIPLDKK